MEQPFLYHQSLKFSFFGVVVAVVVVRLNREILMNREGMGLEIQMEEQEVRREEGHQLK